ncbi:[acyl-carrier-protein] S-malonyltransferase [Deltaproteobacteria bacterium Smac51]|nr:[acyl-carrier-protein] S-malonyltransferase [Deltaproteobacteria bacterium Smac51]
MSVAFIFPGQGGQFVGQGQAWVQKDPSLMEVFKMADDISGRPISKLCFEGPAEDLSKTINLQPAVLAVSLAALRLMKAASGKPSFTAGHSLGEFGALCAAEVIDENTAMALVTKRAALMDANAAKIPGAMMAVIGMPAEELEPICELARNEGVVIMANFNTPEQIVISGEARAVTAAGKYIKMKNGRAIALPVSGGFHSQLMAEAAEGFAAELEKVEFQNPVCPVVPNGTGILTSDPAEIKKQLLTQITSPVLWTKTVESLLEAGATSFVEAWPKAYLGSMVKKCLPKGSEIPVTFQQ